MLNNLCKLPAIVKIYFLLLILEFLENVVFIEELRSSYPVKNSRPKSKHLMPVRFAA